jgi:hypothetical protein
LVGDDGGPEVSMWQADIDEGGVQQLRGNAPNTMGNFTFEVTLGYRRLEKPCR